MAADTTYNARTVSAANLARKLIVLSQNVIRTRVCSAVEITDRTDMHFAASSNMSSYNYIGTTPIVGSMGQAIKTQPSA